MEKSNYNIFRKVVVKEDYFTELFYNFLQFKTIRNLLFDLINTSEFDKSNIEYEHFETQFITREFGTPDLVISNDEVEILFENKINFNTQLTSNQPKGYIRYLENESKKRFKALILFIPENYNYKEDYEKQKNDILKEFGNGVKIYTQTIYWNELIRSIETLELNVISPLFDEYYKFLKEWFELPDIKFNPINIRVMFSKEIPETLDKLMDIVDKVQSEITKRGYKIKESKTSYDDTGYETGFYFLNKGKKILFFGIWLKFWEEYSKPLCICLEDTDSPELMNKFKKACREFNFTELEYKGYPVTYLEKEIIMDKDSYKSIVKLLEEFSNKLN